MKYTIINGDVNKLWHETDDFYEAEGSIGMLIVAQQSDEDVTIILSTKRRKGVSK